MRIALFSCCLLALLVVSTSAIGAMDAIADAIKSTSAIGAMDAIADAIKRSRGFHKKSLSDELIDNKELLRAYLLLKENELQEDADEDAPADKLAEKASGPIAAPVIPYHSH